MATPLAEPVATATTDAIAEPVAATTDATTTIAEPVATTAEAGYIADSEGDIFGETTGTVAPASGSNSPASGSIAPASGAVADAVATTAEAGYIADSEGDIFGATTGADPVGASTTIAEPGTTTIGGTTTTEPGTTPTEPGTTPTVALDHDYVDFVVVEVMDRIGSLRYDDADGTESYMALAEARIEVLKRSGDAAAAKRFIGLVEERVQALRPLWSDAIREMSRVLRAGLGDEERSRASDGAVEASHRLAVASKVLRLAEKELHGVIHPCSPEEMQRREKAYVDRCKHLFLRRLRDVSGTFDVDDENRNIVSQVFYWAMNMPHRTTLDCRKGLLLLGSVGSGKTTLMRGLRLFLRDVRPFNETHQPQPGFGFVDCLTLTRKYVRGGVDVVERFSKIPFCFDEFGREDMGRHGGNTSNVLAGIVQTRYDRGLMTHFSTNMTEEDLCDAYGSYVFDRIKAMCNVVLLYSADSRRQGSREIFGALK